MNVTDFLKTFQVELSTSDSDVNSHSMWIVWGIYDGVCSECTMPLVLIAATDDTSEVSQTGILCLAGLHLIKAANFGLVAAGLIKSRLNLALEQMGFLGTNLNFFDSSKAPTITVSVTSQEISSDVPLPSGFKSVGWIKRAEADVVIKCYQEKSDQELTNASGRVTFVARFVPDTDGDARKYHANCEASRLSTKGVGKRMWLRESEVRAVREANDLGKDIEYSHAGFGSGGLVQFFHENHPAARKYFSTTRLLRRF